MQQINLFRHLPQPIKSSLDLKMLSLLYAAFLMLLMIFSFFNLIGNIIDDYHLKHATKSFSEAQQHLAALAAKYPQTVSQMRLPDLNKLQTCRVKFSNYLADIAEASVSGIWLTEIDILDHGQTVHLKGNTLSEGQVQTYVEELNKKPMFAATSLYLQDIREGAPDAKTGTGILTFTLTTRAANVHQ